MRTGGDGREWVGGGGENHGAPGRLAEIRHDENVQAGRERERAAM